MKITMTQRQRGTALMTAAVALMFGLAACSSGSDAPADTTESGPIVVGAAIAESGFIEAYDQPSYKSFQLKVKQINEAGGIEGRKIELRVNDTKSDVKRGGQAAQELIEKGADIILVSCDFDFGSPAAAAAQKAGKVSITLCASSPKFGVQAIGDKAFSFQPSVGNQAAVLAAFAEKQGYGKGFVLLDDTLSYTRGMNSAFIKFFEAGGGTVAGEDSFKNDDSSVATQINKIKAADPDFILLNSYPPGGASALRQIRAAGIDVPIIDGEAFDGTYWVDAVPDLNDFYITTDATVFGDDVNPEVNEWAKAYEAEYGEPPSKGQSVVGYAIGQGLEIALKKTKGNTDGATLAKALETFKDEKLVTGPTTFDAQTHIPLQNPLVVLKYTGGKPAYVETVTPTAKVSITDGVG